MISLDKHDWLKETFALITLDEDLLRQPLPNYRHLLDKEKDQLRQTQVFKDEVIQVLGWHENFGLVKKFDGTLGWISSKSFELSAQVRSFLKPSSRKIRPDIFLQELKGTVYVFGGISKFGIDCSGFTQLYYIDVFDKVLPKNSYDQRKLGVSVTADIMQDHDLVFCRPHAEMTSHHVAVYYNGLLWHSRRKGGVVSHTLEDFQKEFEIEDVRNLKDSPSESGLF